MKVVKDGDKWFRGSEANAAKMPGQIAEKMKGMKFKSFDGFRNKFWKLVADDPVLSKGFSGTSLNRLRNGKAPLVKPSQQLGANNVYELHHKIPINKNGAVYDFDNLVIVTPKYHKEILSPNYHQILIK